MAADLVINIVEGAQGGQPPTPPAMPAPAPAPPPFVQPPPPVGIPDSSPRVPAGERAPRATPEEKSALEELRRANRHLDATAAGIVGLGQQIFNGIRVPSVERLVSIGQGLVSLLAGQRTIDIVRGGVRNVIGRNVELPEVPISAPAAGVTAARVGAAAAGAAGTGAGAAGSAGAAGAGAAGAGAAGAGAAGAGAAGAGAAAAGIAAAGIAALGGPVGVAVVAGIVAMGTAGIAAALVIRQWSALMQQNIVELSQYSGVLSAQRGIQQFEMTMLEMERARRLEDPLSRMQVRGDRLEQLQYEAMTELLSVGASLFKIVEPFFETFVDTAEITVKVLAKLAEFIEVYLKIAAMGFEGLPTELKVLVWQVKIALNHWFDINFNDPPKENLRERLMDMLEGLQNG